MLGLRRSALSYAHCGAHTCGTLAGIWSDVTNWLSSAKHEVVSAVQTGVSDVSNMIANGLQVQAQGRMGALADSAAATPPPLTPSHP